MRLRNFTPHDVVLIRDDGTQELFPSEGSARLTEEKVCTGYIGDTPIYEITYRETSGLPEREPGVRIIVSREFARHVRREDLIFPNDPVRDGRGRTIGCRSWGVLASSN